MSATIGRVALYVELDGKAKLVALPQDRLQMLVQLAESLSDSGRLRVVDAPGITFEQLHQPTPSSLKEPTHGR